MEKTTKKAMTVGEALNKVVRIKIYNPFIENIRTERPDLLDRILDEDTNSSIITHLYRNFKRDEKEVERVNDFYEKLQSLYN